MSRVLEVARQGMMRAASNINFHANEIAKPISIETGEPDYVENVVGLQLSKHAYTANAKVLMTCENLEDMALDLLA